MLRPKVKCVWSVHKQGPEYLEVIVQDHQNRRYHADFDPVNGTFNVQAPADLEGLPPQDVPAGVPNPNVCAGMWVCYDDWMQRFAPNKLEEQEKSLNWWLTVSVGFAGIVLLIALVWIAVTLGKHITGFTMLTLAGFLGAINAIPLYIARKHGMALLAGIIGTAVTVIGVMIILTRWIAVVN